MSLRFNLDHFCPQVREMQGAEGIRPHPAKICHSHAFKGQAEFGSPKSEVRRPQFSRLGKRLLVLFRKTCIDLFETCSDLFETCSDLFQTCCDFCVMLAE